MKHPLISVIIPCYNGEKYLRETLRSVLDQTNVYKEVIVVDDGSTDKTAEIVGSMKDSGITYHYQKNAGVSAARNKGLEICQGDHVVFFDADDLMEPDFLSSRVNCLVLHPEYDIIGGNVIRFNDAHRFPDKLRGPVHEHLPEDILLYKKEVTTCPSNFMHRKQFLINKQLRFNTLLSSTADRFFLLQCHQKGKLLYSETVSPLLYRISENSMSNQMSPGLVKDNELFYREVIKNDLIPSQLVRPALSKGYWILAGANKKIGRVGSALYYLGLSFTKAPTEFLKRFAE